MTSVKARQYTLPNMLFSARPVPDPHIEPRAAEGVAALLQALKLRVVRETAKREYPFCYSTF